MGTSDPTPGWDEIARERSVGVLERAFIAAQLGMPSEDHETAVETLRIMLAALLVDHLSPDARTIEDRAGRRVSIGEHWQRIVTTGVTHTFVLAGGFVQPDQLLIAVDERASGGGRSGRGPRGQGTLVLRVHDDLALLDATGRSGRTAGADDMAALVDLLAHATIGASLDPPGRPVDDGSPEDRSRGPWSRPSTVAATFGIPDASLVEVRRDGWECEACGCFFAGTVEGTVAYPDRFAPVGRDGPCDRTTECACHAAPVQREIR